MYKYSIKAFEGNSKERKILGAATYPGFAVFLYPCLCNHSYVGLTKTSVTHHRAFHVTPNMLQEHACFFVLWLFVFVVVEIGLLCVALTILELAL